MFISVSSSYNWYNYQGKSIKFEDHHPEYDLELKPGELFGIKGNKLVHDGETGVQFKMTDAEVKSLIKKSALLNYDHDLYPRLALPCTNSDVAKVYAYYNKRIFNNELPKKITFRVMNAKSTEGKARYKNGEYTLYYGKSAMTDVPFFCNMVIHEMIHILHYKRLFEDNRKEYDEAGHGPLFVDDMNRINKLGYKIVTVVTERELAQMQKPVYIVVFPHVQRSTTPTVFNSSKFVAPFYSEKPFDPELVLEDLKVRYGAYPGEYRYGTTRNASALKQNKLTSTGRIPGRISITNTTVKFDDVDIIKHKVLDHRVEDVNNAVVRAVNDAKVAGIQLPHLQYIQDVLNHAGFHKQKVTSVTKNTTHATDAEFKYIADSWYTITDEQIKFMFKHSRKDMLKRGLDGEEAIDKLVEIYNISFRGRVEPKRYAELAAKYFDIITMSARQIIMLILNKLR